ncbi:dTDP-4-amino-4,6-dideoxygalactose transaminase [bacterium]|jgi:dTDP-4-amino-4,6-dideoxygalactose transaminase|nr:dTDP-4-amino-4,6-dideoxygalactose transaminase [bacterium]
MKSNQEIIGFNKPFLTGRELEYIQQAHGNAQLAGDGEFTYKSQAWLQENLNVSKALLTHSCTAALEMAAILLDIMPGDEIIMPSYTFVTTANAFVLRGGVPIFVDIKQDTLNINEMLIEAAITEKTKAIVVVHYGGFSCDMDYVLKIAKKHNLMVVEDAAQAMMSSYKNKYLGTIGDIGCLSFHETKNIISGEGGAILINNLDLIERAEVIREKGTDRKKFNRGEVDKYSWKDIGSSYLPGEIVAAFLFAQLEQAHQITNNRKKIWDTYHEYCVNLPVIKNIRFSTTHEYLNGNGHLFFLLLEDLKSRNLFIDSMQASNITCVTHYVPLHSSAGGKKFGKTGSEMTVTNSTADRLVRLPLWIGLTQDRVLKAIKNWNSLI